MDRPISFLVVDDERTIVTQLRSIINQTFPNAIISTAYDGDHAYRLIEENHPDVVISDIVMPGLSGLQLCKKLRENKFEDIYFIVLTESNDPDSKIMALEKGADEYLSKPIIQEELLVRLYSASRFISLQTKMKEENQLLMELAEQLEHDIQDMIMVSIKFLQARFPTSTDMLRRVADSSVWIASQLDFTPEGIKEIEIASLLCYAGKIALPDEYTKIPILIDGMPSHQIMYQLPGTSKEIVSTMRRFKDIATILYHLFENFDGSGFPEKLSKWQIPISSRIIRVALDYEEMRYHTKMRPGQIISDLRKHSNRLYDHRMITLLEQYLASVGADPDVKEKARKFHELREGMVLSRDVYTNSGLKLMTAGTILTARYIERIQSHNTSDPILGNIIVRVD